MAVDGSLGNVYVCLPNALCLVLWVVGTLLNYILSIYLFYVTLSMIINLQLLDNTFNYKSISSLH